MAKSEYCMLAQTYSPKKHDELLHAGGWVAQPKLDGVRMVVIDGEARTRNNKVIHSVGHVLEALDELAHEYVWDGEIMGPSQDFDQISGRVRKQSGLADEQLIFHAWDVVPFSAWQARALTAGYLARWDEMTRLFAGRPCLHSAAQVVPIAELTSTADIDNAYAGFLAQGYEGIMLKDGTAPYEWKRSWHLLKHKPVLDLAAVITEVFPGEGKHKGRAGGIVVEHNGVETRVGTGFNDTLRTTLWREWTSFLGRTVEIEYQNLTANGVMRFPRFKRFRPDLE